MRWSLKQLLLLILALAIGLATCRAYWGESAYMNSRIVFAVYLAALSSTSLAAYWSPLFVHFWRGYALFGWCYLVFVLRGGFGFTPDVYAPNLTRLSEMGMAMSIACGFVALALVPKR
jgi:hypothetical protein